MAYIQESTDLLGRSIAQATGPALAGDTLPLFDRDHAFTEAEKAARKAEAKRKLDDARNGQMEMFA